MPRQKRSANRNSTKDPSEAAACYGRLANGLKVVLCPRPSLAQTYVALYFGVGSRHEERSDNGITHVLEHMLFRGTKSYPDATSLNAAAEDFGGFLEGATYRDHLAFGTACHPSALGEAVAILGELVQTPRYRAMDIEKQILREELLETLDKDGRVVDPDNITHTSVFGEYGLGLPIEGTQATLERLDRSTLEVHRKRYLVASNAVVSVAGPFEEQRLLRQINRAFGGLALGERPQAVAPPPPRQEPVLRYVRDPGSQVDLRVTFRGVSMHDEDYPALVLLARLLADGLSSRLHAELVDKQGLAYALHAGLTTYEDCGLFDFEVAVAPDRAAAAVEALLGFVRGARRFRYSKDELLRTRRRYRYSMEFMDDAAADLASWHGRAALFDVETEMARLEQRIGRLSIDAIHHAARRVFCRPGLVITAVGELARGEWGRLRRVVQRWR